MRRSSRGTLLLAVLGAALLGWTGCGSDDGGGGDFGLTQKGLIELDPKNDVLAVDVGQTTVGGELLYPIRIINVGQGLLTVSSVTLTYNTPDSGDAHGTAFTLEPVGAPLEIAPKGSGEGTEEVVVNVRFTRQPNFESRSATLTIESDSLERQLISIALIETQSAAVAKVSPSVLQFATVKLKETIKKTVTIANTGTDTLIVDRFVLKGHPDFTLHIPDGATYPVSEITQNIVSLEEPLTVAPEATTTIDVSFTPQTDSPAAGELILFANDGDDAGHSVVLLANNDVPCIKVDPAEASFGGKIVGNKSLLPIEISNCGQPALKISGIYMDPEQSDGDFKTALFQFPGVDPVVGPSADAPLVLEANQSIVIDVQYVPDVVSPLDADNKPIPDLGVLVIDNNSFEAKVEVPVSGNGLKVECPLAIATVEEGQQVVPQTVLHLTGDQSYSPSGLAITSWFWEVPVAPEGTTSVFIPGATFDNPVFEVNIAGLYQFQLTVVDEVGADSCEPAVVDVVVIPDEAIHVELIWSTEGDVDSEDTGEGNGTDMDLHFTHPFATGPDIDGDGEPDPWFDTDFDCFWFNKTPNWGTFDEDVDDNPSLDGWGPENLNINIPEEGVTYTVGVHYWDDHGFGDSKATVRIYIYGELDFEYEDHPMTAHDLWKVAEIPWFGGDSTTELLTDESGELLVTPNYQNPFFLSPQ